MLSLLSGQVPSSPSGFFFKVGGDRLNDNIDRGNSKLSKAHRSSHVGSYLTTVNLIICLLAAGTLVQCDEAKELDYASQEWKPCICNSTFYKYCPEASKCIENTIEDIAKMTKPPHLSSDMTGLMAHHDDMHPDHVDITPSFGPYDMGRNLDMGSDEERILRHRKVYVARRQHSKPLIETISIRIPLEIPTIEPPNIPEPKSIYKLKKYTTYESRPEIQMVPVTKTIIKPVGVSPDQIINDNPTKMVA